MSNKGHRQLMKVRHRSMGLAQQVHRLAAGFASKELYGLVSQMCRAAVSLPSNIAEGYGRGGKDYARFVSIAYGFLLELETQLELARRFGCVDDAATAAVTKTCSEVGRMLNGLRNSLTRPQPTPKP